MLGFYDRIIVLFFEEVDKMIKRIIFDIDGTLITGVNFKCAIMNALRKYGVNDLEKVNCFLVNIDEYENTYGFYDRDLYLDFFSEKLNIRLDYTFLNLFFNELKKLIPVDSSKIKTMLMNLSDYDLVLLSNYFEVSQRNRLRAMGINDFFNEYYGEKSVKPNLSSYKSAQGDYLPCECLIIGDNKKLDIDIPKSLGFKTIYVNNDGDIDSVEKLSVQLIKKL